MDCLAGMEKAIKIIKLFIKVYLFKELLNYLNDICCIIYFLQNT